MSISSPIAFQGVGKDGDAVSEVSLLNGFLNKAEENSVVFFFCFSVLKQTILVIENKRMCA